MVKHQVYHKLNVLSTEDFNALVAYKDNIINQGKGFTTIEEDGSISIDTTLKTGVITDTPLVHDYEVSKELILNKKLDIDGFIQVLGQPFYPAFANIQKLLTNAGIKNPRPFNARAYRHNNPYIPWHRHTVLKNYKPSGYWITIYYLHPNWDVAYGGALRVGLDEITDILVANCISNSVVIHNGYYGHGVQKVLPGFEGDRDILLIHWLSD